MKHGVYEFGGTDRFRIIRQLGEGGSGVVYEAEDRNRGQRVALKTLKQHDLETLYRLKREFRSLADLSHPNLIHLYDMVLEDDLCFYTMELVSGYSLIEYCRPDKSGDDWAEAADTLPAFSVLERSPEVALDEERLRHTMPQLAAGLVALHDAGLVHRDIKPSNVLINRDGRLVLLDFGLVADLDDSVGDSLAGHIVGTVEYMAPEQAGGAAVTAAADWYSVGVLLYEALTGRVPHSGSLMKILMGKQGYRPPPPRQIQPGVSADLDALCEDLLAREPARRPSGAEVLSRLGRAAEAPDSGPRAIPQQVPFAGREIDLVKLHECFETTLGGTSAVAMVRGPSGIGKTALVRRCLDSLQVDYPDLVVLEGRCYDSETVPYKAMDAVIDRLSRYWTQMPRVDAVALLPRHPWLLTRLFPMLGRVPAVAGAPRERNSEPPQELRTSAFAALREVLFRLAERQPLVLFLDDLQWGDADSLTLLADLLRPPDPPPLFLLLCSRAEMAPIAAGGTGSFITIAPNRRSVSIGLATGIDALWRVIGAPDIELDLGPLSADAALGLARHVIKDGRPGLAERVAEEAAGIPFFIAELGMYLHSIGSNQVGSVRLDDVLRERVARLPVHERELLEVVAVAGEPLSQRVAASALERSSEELARVIRHLRTEHLVRVPSGASTDQVECYHDRIRECVRRGLAIPRRRELFRGLAIALEQWSEGTAERRARYWRGAGETQRAAEYAREAGKEATNLLDFDRGARLHQLALELGEYDEGQRREILRELGEAYENAGRPAQAADAFLSAARGAPPGEGLELRHRSASVLLRGGYVEQGMAAIEEVLAEIGLKLSDSPQRAIASVLWRRVFLRVRGLRFRQRAESDIPRRALIVADVCNSVAEGLGLVDNIRGAEFQARSLMLALRCGEPSRIARTLGIEAGYLAGYGKEKRALRVIAESERISSEFGDGQSVPHALWARGAVSMFCGNEWRRSLGHFDDGIAALRRNRLTRGWEMVTGQIYRAVAFLRLGELNTLSRHIQRQIGQAERRGDLYASVTLRIRCNAVWLVRDDADEAEYELEDALAAWLSPATAFQLQHAWGMNARCELALYRAEPERAWQVLEGTWPQLSRSLLFRIPSVKIDCLHTRARVVLAQAARHLAVARGEGESVEPGEYVREAVACARRIDKQKLPLAQVFAGLVRASVAEISGDAAAAVDLMREALIASESMELMLYATSARYRLGQLIGGTDGSTLVAEAELWLREQGVVNPEAIVAMHVPGIFAAREPG